MPEHRIICEKCGDVLTLADFPGFCPGPRCEKCGGMFYGVVDGRGGLGLRGLAGAMADVELKDVKVREILLDAETYSRLKHKIGKSGKLWGSRVLMDGCFIPDKEQPYEEDMQALR